MRPRHLGVAVLDRERGLAPGVGPAAALAEVPRADLGGLRSVEPLTVGQGHRAALGVHLAEAEDRLVQHALSLPARDRDFKLSRRHCVRRRR